MDEEEYKKRYSALHKVAMGKQLKKWRQHRNYTQRGLGHEISMSPEHISRIESGVHRIYAETLGCLYSELDIDMNDLFKNVTEEANRLIKREE